MSLSQSLEHKKFDSRLIEWNLKNGVVSQAEYDQYMSSLEDASDNAESLELEIDEPEATTSDTPEEEQSGNGSLVF